MELTKNEQIVLEIIKKHTKENKIYDKWVRNEVSISDPSEKPGAGLRRVINALRQKGFAICSDTKGYWYAQNKQELLDNAQALRGRAVKIINAAQGMERAAELYETMNQTPLL